MPTYDYVCKECGHTFEEFQSMSSEFLTVCPSCGKPALKRQMAGGAGMIFKGSGFYSTDYRKTNSSSSTSSTSDAGAAKQETKSPLPSKTDSPPAPSKPDSSQSGSKPDSSK
ncbi:MAG: zinc ribbon domain-containing protein [Ignavibacteriales bacterium]|nr:zinc ribbon domain-containing protein [Ignavibacteriales bacterium]